MTTFGSPRDRAESAARERAAKREADSLDRAKRITAAQQDREHRRIDAQMDREARRMRSNLEAKTQPAKGGPKKPEFQRTLQTFFNPLGFGADLDIVIEQWQVSLSPTPASDHTERTNTKTGIWNEGPPESWTEDGEHSHNPSLTLTFTLSTLSFGSPGIVTGLAGQAKVNFEGSDYNVVYYNGAENEDPPDTSRHLHTITGTDIPITTDISGDGELTWGSEDGAHSHAVSIPPLEYTYVLYALTYELIGKSVLSFRHGSIYGHFDYDDLANRPTPLSEDKTITYQFLVK